MTYYLTTVECENGHEVTYCHFAPEVPLDRETPWPDVEMCPKCGEDYPDDLAVAITEVADVERFTVGKHAAEELVE